MRETVWNPPRTTAITVPAAIASRFDAFAAAVTGRSAIIWGEHCSECSFPACQSTCAFYAPRPDLICRRFEAGIEPVTTPAGTRLSRIRFRKWGKLEGRGPVSLRSPDAVCRLDAADGAAEAAMRAVPLPFSFRLRAMHHLNEAKHRLAAKSGAMPATDFVIESWSPLPGASRFNLTFLSETDGTMFQHGFEVEDDYVISRVPVTAIAAHINLDQPYLVQIEPVGEAQGRDVVFGVTEFVTVAHWPSPPMPLAPAPLAKLVVWDLDNTLWDGTLAEDGIEGIRLRPGVRAVLDGLDARGILHSIASKNEPESALAALAAFGIDHLFLHPQIGWHPKSDSIATIASRLDLGIDSFIFVDDQPFERGEVAASHPTLMTLDDDAGLALLDHPRCAVPVTDESRQRRERYRAEAGRNAVMARSGMDYTAFLRSCGITLTASALDAQSAERVYELSQRTNQLNFRGTRYSRTDVDALTTGDRQCFVLSCADRFGDYGAIGFAVLDRHTATVDDFFMSCRVQRKRVEHCFFQHLLDLVARDGHPALTVRYRPTSRNPASLRLLEEIGFVPGNDDPDGDALWTREPHPPIGDADIVALILQPSVTENPIVAKNSA